MGSGWGVWECDEGGGKEGEVGCYFLFGAAFSRLWVMTHCGSNFEVSGASGRSLAQKVVLYFLVSTL